MKRRLLLILPRLQQLDDYEYRLIKYTRFPPLSLLTLAGLTPDDWEVIVRDEHVESSEVDGHFDLVGIQTYISSSGRAYELAKTWRERGAKVVLGGLHPTSLPDEAALHADAVCTGPAESVWREILDDFEHGRLRPLYHGRRHGTAAMTPLPRRDLMNPRAYLLRHTMVTSRGCPHSCDFCYKNQFWGPDYYEPRPIDQIERELSEVDDGLVFFLDDNLLGAKRHARNMFQLLKGSGLVWQAAASLDVTRDPAFLEEAYEAGCRSLFVGFESITPANMAGNNKRVNVATDYQRACKIFHDAGIMINGSFVFGFDHDDADVFERTVEFAIDAKLLTATFHILTPLPGTKSFERLDAEGRILHRDWRYYDTDHAVFQPARMTAEQLERGHKRAYDQFSSYGSILRRSIGLPGFVKRVAYNVAWNKVDPLWGVLIRMGAMPLARRIFERVLRISTRQRRREAEAYRKSRPSPEHASETLPIVTPTEQTDETPVHVA